MSKKPRTIFRKLDGILLLDKPQGLSSNQALQRVRHLFRAEKAGHTGSLDPLATGLLPVCFGEATKIAGLLLGSRKAYETAAELGLTTDSDDSDGAPLLQRDIPAGLDDATIEAALGPLRGAIRQRAPIYSALKQGGEPLYAKARRGEAIEAPEREVVVHQLRASRAATARACACMLSAAPAPMYAAWSATSARRWAAAPTSPRCGDCGSTHSPRRACTRLDALQALAAAGRDRAGRLSVADRRRPDGVPAHRPGCRRRRDGSARASGCVWTACPHSSV